MLRRDPQLFRGVPMADLSAFPITKKWPAKNPDVLQLYSLPTPNGVKVSIMLEEIGLPYEAHKIDIGANETWTPEFLSLNPNGKIPAILDPHLVGVLLAPQRRRGEAGADLDPLDGIDRHQGAGEIAV